MLYSSAWEVRHLAGAPALRFGKSHGTALQLEHRRWRAGCKAHRGLCGLGKGASGFGNQRRRRPGTAFR